MRKAVYPPGPPLIALVRDTKLVSRAPKSENDNHPLRSGARFTLFWDLLPKGLGYKKRVDYPRKSKEKEDITLRAKEEKLTCKLAPLPVRFLDPQA